MLPASHYRRAWREATFHVQVELLEIPSPPRTPCMVQVSARVVRVFHARATIQSGDIIQFDVAVNRPGDEIPFSGTIWMNYESLRSHRYLEAFFNGDPPDCQLALWQCKLLESPSRGPQL